MKYVVGVLAIFGEFIVYVMISAIAGWKYGGGGLVTLLLFAVFGATWRAIMKHFKTKEAGEKPREDVGVHETN